MSAVIAGAILIIAAILHGWYGGNAKATPGNAAEVFYRHGKAVLLVTIILLITGLIIFWKSATFLVAIAAAGVYFFILPLIIMPLLEKLSLVPDKACRFTASEHKAVLRPKAGESPRSSLNDYPLLKLYFDDFSELKNAARQGAFDVAMQRDYEGQGIYRFEGILSDEKRFLDFYRNNMLRLRLSDGTIIDREKEMKLWDKVLHPEKLIRKPVEAAPGIHPRTLAELDAFIEEADREEKSIIDALKRRYGIPW
jgi:hypothetical protein